MREKNAKLLYKSASKFFKEKLHQNLLLNDMIQMPTCREGNF